MHQTMLLLSAQGGPLTHIISRPLGALDPATSNPPPPDLPSAEDPEAETSSLSKRRNLRTSSSSSRALSGAVAPDAYTDIEALSWVTDTARALAYLHSQRPAVVHRDVKTENILLTSVPLLLQLPMGVARGTAVTLASVFKPASASGAGAKEQGTLGADDTELPVPRRAKLADLGLHVVSSEKIVALHVPLHT